MKKGLLDFYAKSESSRSQRSDYVYRIRYVDEMLSEIPIKKKKVVDIGCGDCHYVASKLLASADFILGLDISLKALHVGKRKGIDVILADAEYLPLRNDSFDLVLCMEVIEHLLHPEKEINELCRIGRKWIVISTQNREGNRTINPFMRIYGRLIEFLVSRDWQKLSDKSFQEFLQSTSGHISTLSHKELVKLVLENGLLIDKLVFYLRFPHAGIILANKKIPASIKQTIINIDHRFSKIRPKLWVLLGFIGFGMVARLRKTS